MVCPSHIVVREVRQDLQPILAFMMWCLIWDIVPSYRTGDLELGPDANHIKLKVPPRARANFGRHTHWERLFERIR
jgi:hypothetical protein